MSAPTRPNPEATAATLMRGAFEFSSIGKALVDESGRWIRVNRALCDLLGYEPEELVRLRFVDVTHPDDRYLGREEMGRLRAGRLDAFTVNKRYVTASGGTIWARTSATAVHDASGRFECFLAEIIDETERRRAEALRRESEQRLELALAGADLGSWDWDLRSGRVIFNERWATMLGYRLDELEQHFTTWQRLVHPDDFARAGELLKAHVIDPTVAYEAEIRMRARDGEWIWVLTKGRVYQRDSNGRALRAAGTHLDITARKLAEESLELQASVLGRMVEGVFVSDEVGRVLYANPACGAMFGESEERLVGRSVLELIDSTAEEGGRCLDEIGARLRSGDVWSGELKHRRHDTTPFVTQTGVSLLEAGERRLWVWVQQDVTENRRTADLLRETQTMARVGGWAFELATSRLTWTDEVYRIHELPIGTPVDVDTAVEFYHADDRETIRDAVERGLRGEGGWDLELRLITARGREIWVRAIGSVHRRNDEAYRISGTFQDITELKRVEQLKDDLVSVVSHELRTPLTSIGGSLSLLRAGVSGTLPDSAHRMVDVAARNTERLVRLINDMLDLQKIEAGALELERRVLELDELVEQAVENGCGLEASGSVRFVTELGAGTARVRADADRITQVVTNLLSNAVKFSPQDGRIEVATSATDDRVRLTVRDHGPGIPVDAGRRVFERFVQVDGSNRRSTGGTGLGLSICESIVEQHDGCIGHEPADGGGTIFVVELPRHSGDRSIFEEK